MGVNKSREVEMEFYFQRDDPLYGPGQIYTSTKFPHCFIIKIIKSIPNSSRIELLSQIENAQNINLLGLYGYSLGKSCHCSTAILTHCATLFWEYLPFSVDAILDRRRAAKRRFEEQEIWHIIKACSNVMVSLTELNIYYDFYLQNLLVNHEGKIRVSWMHIQEKNQHLRYFSAYRNSVSGRANSSQFSGTTSLEFISMDPMSEEDVGHMSPEELESISSLEFTRKIDFSKSNVFSLGIMLLQCCTFVDTQRPYYQDRKVNYPFINFAMVNYMEPVYSQPLIKLIASMLHQKGQLRPSPATLETQFGNRISKEYHIKMSSSKEVEEFLKEQHGKMLSPQKVPFGRKEKPLNQEQSYPLQPVYLRQQPERKQLHRGLPADHHPNSQPTVPKY